MLKEACDTADATDVIRRAFKQKCYDQGGAPISSSTKTFSVVHTLVNTANDEIPELVEINNDHNYGIFTHSSYDDENWDFQDNMVEGAVADNNYMVTSITKYGSTRPVEDLDLVLYGDLKTMFEPHVEDNVWKNQSDYKVLDWKLYDSCGVHLLRKQNVHIHMLVEKRYPLTAPTITDMLNRSCKLIIGMKYLLMKKRDDFGDKYQVYRRIVGIKRLLDDLRVTTAQLMLLVYKLLLSVLNLKAQIQEKVFANALLKNELKKLKGKNVIDTVVSKPHATTIAPRMYKLELEPLPPKVLKNIAHIAYIKHSRDHADTLRDIVESARELSHLDSNLDSACKYVQRIQDALVYVRDTCPCLTRPSEKLVGTLLSKYLNKLKSRISRSNKE
ncbi:hypothetical protein Tco_0869167 [Tanacetum coccineum]